MLINGERERYFLIRKEVLLSDNAVFLLPLKNDILKFESFPSFLSLPPSFLSLLPSLSLLPFLSPLFFPYRSLLPSLLRPSLSPAFPVLPLPVSPFFSPSPSPLPLPLPLPPFTSKRMHHLFLVDNDMLYKHTVILLEITYTATCNR